MEREEQDLRAKLRREQDDRRHEDAWRSKAGEERDLRGGEGNPGPQADFHCFNCDGTGHMRKDCKNPPFCYCCKKSGHRSSVCPEKRGLRLCGFGIPGQGFYSIHISTDKAKSKKEVRGILVVETGEASVEIIEKELIHLFNEVPKWSIRKMGGENEYMISFPTEDIRHQCSRFRSFEFETAEVKAKVIPTDISPDADGSLELVWVKAFNLHPDARKEDTVMELAYLIGDPTEVDLKTLDSQGPVRVRVACREAKEIGGETKVYFNGEGYTIRWELEMPREQVDLPKGSKFDRQRDREDDDYEEEERDKDPLNRQKMDSSMKTGWATMSNAGKGGGGMYKQAAIDKDTSVKEKTTMDGSHNQVSRDKRGKQNMENTLSGVMGEQNHEEGELIDSNPELGLEKGCSQEEEKNLNLQQSYVEGDTAVDMETEGEELVDYEEEPMNTEKFEMANLERNIEERAKRLLDNQAIKIPLAEDTSDNDNQNSASNKSGEDTDEIYWDKVGSNLWSDEEKEATPKKVEGKAEMEVRRSARITGGTLKIQERAEASKRKQNEISGKSSSFSILSSVDPQVLRSIALVSNINLGDDDLGVANSISLIQANENARVALFTTKKKIVEASQKKRMESETQTDDDRGGMDNSGETDPMVNDGDMIRPSKKPPRQTSTSRKGGGGGQNKKKKT
jgi:hypothetical protein